MDNTNILYILLFLVLLFLIFKVSSPKEQFLTEQCHEPEGIDNNCNRDIASGNSIITNAYIDYDNKYNNRLTCCSDANYSTGTNFLPNVKKIFPYEVDCQSKQALLSYYNSTYGDIYHECRTSAKPLTCREITIPCSTDRQINFNCEGDEGIGKIAVDTNCTKLGDRTYKYTCCKPL